MTETSTLDPLTFFEYDHNPGNYCLLLSDTHMVPFMDVFEECEQYGSGYGWTGVARSAIRSRAPELLDRVSFDPEAGMFVAYGTDPEALQALGALLKEALTDKAVLKHLIETGDPAWFD
ncbi:Imm51 family immunity protein [Streptomyces sp. NPDC008317]|uniref:immunity 51 family protein n=1 Tax=Streptomyces sp. NPDC008317 TaxID=3364827 RepID=UPI0036EC0883